MCGGDPGQVLVKNASKIVFSTCVEVIPFSVMVVDMSAGILHVCGGDPANFSRGSLVVKYSPRVWR